MKKILLSLPLLLLTACGSEADDAGGETDESEEVFYFEYRTSDFEMNVPEDWETVDSFTSEFPDEVVVAFRNNVRDDIFTANVSVVKEANIQSDTSYDYAQRKLDDHEGTLLNYVLTSQEVINLTVRGASSKTMLSQFEGRNSTSSPTLDFMQVTLTDGTDAYVATATYRPGEDAFTVEQMEKMLKSFTLR